MVWGRGPHKGQSPVVWEEILLVHARIFHSLPPRFLLSFQIFLFATFWPLPNGWFRNYCLRTMCSYLLGVWIKEGQRPPIPPPPPSLRRRHHLNRRSDLGDDVNVEHDANALDGAVDNPSPSNSLSPPSAYAPPFFFSSPSAAPRLYAANCVTPLDGAMLTLLRSDVRVINTIKLNPFLSWILGYRSLHPSRPIGVDREGADGSGTAAALRLTPLEIVAGEELASGLKGIVTFPEMSVTNGKAVLKFEEKLLQWRQTKPVAHGKDPGPGETEARVIK